MTLTTLGLILVSVTISAMAQICLKLGMSSVNVQHAMAASTSNTIYATASNPAILGGLALYGLGAITWLFVLAKTDVTLAYPFVGVGFLITLAIGYFFLSEPVTLLRMVGVVLVVAGIGLVARS